MIGMKGWIEKDCPSNENIKEYIANENAVKYDQSQFSHDILTGMVINKDCDNTTGKYVKDKT